jgi:hypothetical protein
MLRESANQQGRPGHLLAVVPGPGGVSARHYNRFDEDVIHPASTTVHADLDFQLAQPGDPLGGRELTALISIEDLWHPARALQGHGAVVIHERNLIVHEAFAVAEKTNSGQPNAFLKPATAPDVTDLEGWHAALREPGAQARLKENPVANRGDADPSFS